jgi:hypothetical protein
MSANEPDQQTLWDAQEVAQYLKVSRSGATIARKPASSRACVLEPCCVSILKQFTLLRAANLRPAPV